MSGLNPSVLKTTKNYLKKILANTNGVVVSCVHDSFFLKKCDKSRFLVEVRLIVRYHYGVFERITVNKPPLKSGGLKSLD